MEKESTKYGACAKHPNSSMIDCTECAMKNGKSIKLKSDILKIKGNPKKPDFDKMWKNIKDRLDNPLVYLIEHKDTKEWLHKREQKTTKERLLAMDFTGKDGKLTAHLFLHLNQ